MRLASILLLLIGVGLAQAAELTYQQELLRTLEKYGTPEKVPATSVEYLAKFGRVTEDMVKNHLKSEYGAAQYAAHYKVPYVPGRSISSSHPYPYPGSGPTAYPYSLQGPYPYPSQGFDPYVSAIYERRYREYWKDEYLNGKGPLRPSRDYWPPRKAQEGEKQRAEAWAKKAWREAYGTWWGYPWDQRAHYLWSDRQTRKYQRNIERARHRADRAFREAYEKEMRARVQAGLYWNGTPWAARASTEYPGTLSRYNYGYNPHAYYGNPYRYGYNWNPPPTQRHFDSPLNRWFQARMRGDVK